MRSLLCLLFLAIGTFALFAQTNSSDVSGRARVYITDSKSWEIGGGGGGTSGGFGVAGGGGDRPQTAEIIKTFGERCPDVIVNNKPERADYVILLDHEGGKEIFLRDNKVAVFNKDGDSILSHSTRTLGNAVKDACESVSKDWPARRARVANEKAGLVPHESASSERSGPGGSAGLNDPKQAELEVVSTPVGADIEIDGNFVGSTPSSVTASPGPHQVVVKKAGYEAWQRKVTVTGGHVRLDAQLEATQSASAR
jgi:hypothetical protein